MIYDAFDSVITLSSFIGLFFSFVDLPKINDLLSR